LEDIHCEYESDEEHRNLYYHNCPHGSDCNLQKFDEDLKRNYIHKRVEKKSCNVEKILVPVTYHPDPNMVAELTSKGFSLCDKENLLPHSKDWRHSAESETADSSFKFIGWQIKDKVSITEKVVLFKSTGKGFVGGFMKSESINDVKINQNSIKQPWFRDTVYVWKHDTIAKVFKKILSGNIPGLKVSYMKFMKSIYDENIPIFIVGGAVRDVIYEVCVNGKNDMDDFNSINGIDFGFGDSVENLEKTIKKQPF
jgi:hypothetical protein